MREGTRIKNSYGHTGTVTLVLDGLDEACEHGCLGPDSDYARAVGDTTDAYTAVSDWLHDQERVPLTPRSGKWLIVDMDSGGEAIVGALDATFLDN